MFEQNQLVNLFSLSSVAGPSTWVLMANLFLTLVFCLVISWVYRRTQIDFLYTHLFVQTLVLFALATCGLTMLIGDNLARAFGVVGALSVIRFRNALKSPLEAGYLFWALVIGVACAVGQYLFALIFSAFLGVVLLLILPKFERKQANHIKSTDTL
jgi:hypothetical protein